MAATQHVPLVWLDCFWTTAISRRAEHEHQPESPNHRKYMNASENIRVSAPQLFAPSANLVYAIGEVERLTRVPQRRILSYCKQGLVSPVEETEPGGIYFDGDAIRALRRIENLRSDFGINLGGIKLIFDLANEVERLRAAVALRPPLPDD